MASQKRASSSASDQASEGAEGALLIRVAGGTVAFTDTEAQRFDRIFHIVDSNEDGVIEGALGAAFLRRSKLPDKILQEVWRLACGGKSKPSLTREPWFVTLKLIGHAQSVKPPMADMKPLLAREYTQLPDFGFGIDRVIADPEKNLKAIPAKAVIVRIKNPSNSTSNMGLTGHTVYEVHTTTTLPHFIFKEMRVRRRYRDFEWLQNRLVSRFLGTAVPNLPVKRIYGNFDPSFVEERRLELQLFVDCVVRHPLLNKSLELEIFLSASRRGVADAQELTNTSQITVTSAMDSFLSLFTSSSPASQTDEDRQAEALTHELTCTEGVTRKAVAMCEALVESERICAAATKQFGIGITDSAAEGGAREKGGDIMAVERLLGAAVGCVAEVKSQRPRILVEQLLTPLRFQLGLIDGCRRVVSNRELLLADCRDASALEQQAEAQAGLLDSKEADRSRQDSQRRVTEARDQMQRMSVSIRREMERAKAAKVDAIGRALRKYVKSQVESAQQLRNEWEATLAQLQATGLSKPRVSSKATRGHLVSGFGTRRMPPVGKPPPPLTGPSATRHSIPSRGRLTSFPQPRR